MQIIQKDITTVEGPALIAHGVNCQRAMGSGVAKALYTKWPSVRVDYMNCPRMVLGHVQYTHPEREITVANCFTQDQFGYDGKKYADMPSIIHVMNVVAEYAYLVGLQEIHIPKIGCGLGGLDWQDVAYHLEQIESWLPVEFIVCEWP